MESKEKRINQSKKILLTAFECISSKGYANTSMRDIADAAEVALSQLNYHPNYSPNHVHLKNEQYKSTL
jgi:AcrR family transcriptional regulator